MDEPLPSLLAAAVAARSALVDGDHRTAFRAFAGHHEGDPRYVIDVYGETAVIFHHAAPLADEASASLARLVVEHLPWIRNVVLKEREGVTEEGRRGRVLDAGHGAGRPDTSIREHGVRYVVDPLMHQDAGFYLDTRELRRWLIEESDGASVLNTFAYTGSLGVAARAGGASRVVHTDLNRRFLNVAKASYALNGFAVDRRDFQARDFFSFVRGLKVRNERFDIVVLDPPFFSTTKGGTVDLNRNATNLINKVRPLVRSGGRLVVVNNSLFVSGSAFMRDLEALCTGGWMAIERMIPVPADVTGYPSTRRGEPICDPAPFEHSTKIVVLRVRHKA